MTTDYYLAHDLLRLRLGVTGVEEFLVLCEEVDS